MVDDGGDFKEPDDLILPDASARTLTGRISTAARRHNVPLATILVTVGVVIAAGIGLELVWVLRRILLYVLVAVFIAVLLSPAVMVLERRGLKRGLATTIVFFLGLLSFAGLAFLFGVPMVNAVSKFAKEVPSLVSQAEHGRGAIGHLISQFNLQHWVQENAPKLSTYAASVSKPALSVGAAALSTLFHILTIAMLAFYVLLELPKIWKVILDLLPSAQAERASRIVTHSSSAVTGYVFGNFVTSVIAGIIVFITLTILGVPFAPLLSLWVALVDLLPLIGGLLAGVPTVLIAFLHGPVDGIVVLVVFIVYQQIENHVLNPLIMSKTVKMSPALVLIAVLVGAVLGGQVHAGFGTFIGALIGIPIGSAIQVLVREVRSAGAEGDAEPIT
jgi:predicted PurR-regulated permease PerM